MEIPPLPRARHCGKEIAQLIGCCVLWQRVLPNYRAVLRQPQAPSMKPLPMDCNVMDRNANEPIGAKGRAQRCQCFPLLDRYRRHKRRTAFCQREHDILLPLSHTICEDPEPVRRIQGHDRGPIEFTRTFTTPADLGNEQATVGIHCHATRVTIRYNEPSIGQQHKPVDLTKQVVAAILRVATKAEVDGGHLSRLAQVGIRLARVGIRFTVSVRQPGTTPGQSEHGHDRSGTQRSSEPAPR